MEKNIATIKIILGVFLAVLVIYLLNILSTIFIPFTLAVFIALIMQPAIRWFKDRKVPYGVSISLIFLVTLIFIMGIGQVIYNTVAFFYKQKDKLGLQISSKTKGIESIIERIPGLKFDNTNTEQILNQVISMDWILQSTKNVVATVGDFTSVLFMVLIFLAATLGGIINYKSQLRYLTQGNDERSSNVINAFEKVQHSILKYLKVKTIVSLTTGIGFWLICTLFGIDFAPFWGFLAFILNFIPTFGSIVASIPPILMGLIQIPGTGSIIFFIVCLALIQIIMGNIIEPKIMGTSLSLNMATIIIGLLFWGYLWGVSGMILSDPLMVLTKVILSQLSDTQVIVRMMGELPKN